MFHLIILIQCLIVVSSSILNITMPNVVPSYKDTYLCYAHKINPDQPLYITEFETNTEETIAHHILLFKCEMPGNEETVWDCGFMSGSNTINDKVKFKKGPVCIGRKQQILYGWAMDAPKLVLPENVAFKIDGKSNDNFLVMQVHYGNIDYFKDNKTDNSGISLKVQNKPFENEAGIFLLGTDGSIRSNKTENFEVACKIQEDIEIIPFAYRTHAHKLGLVNSGYVVKTNPLTSEQEWIEIGRRSPQLPQMFYPATNKNVKINKDDILAARCTMFNFENKTVSVGPTGDDEMCNFYIMYYGKKSNFPSSSMCMSWGPPNWYFENFKELNLSKIPKDASEIPLDQINELPFANQHSGNNMHE